MQLTYLSVDERFFVRFTEETVALYPAGAFSVVSNYPVYALRLREAAGQDATDFLIPGSDGAFYWVDMAHTRLARR